MRMKAAKQAHRLNFRCLLTMRFSYKCLVFSKPLLVFVIAVTITAVGKDQAVRHTLVEIFREHNEKYHKLAGIDMAPATVVRYETSRRKVADAR